MKQKMKTQSGAPQSLQLLCAHPNTTKIVEPELDNVGEKPQDNNELIIHNTVINSIWNQIADTMQGFVPILQEI